MADAQPANTNSTETVAKFSGDLADLLEKLSDKESKGKLIAMSHRLIQLWTENDQLREQQGTLQQFLRQLQAENQRLVKDNQTRE
jgi:predicted  nucleic acid-binding Zn-ribbon protein